MEYIFNNIESNKITYYQSENNDVTFFKFKITNIDKQPMQNIMITWYIPIIDMQNVWRYGVNYEKNLRFDVDSKSTLFAPMACFYNNREENKVTISYSDCIESTHFNIEVNEETAELRCTLTLFTEDPIIDDIYEQEIRMDFRNIPYYKAINECISYYESLHNYKPMEVPNVAKKPFYSTWYAYHQDLKQDEIYNQCILAKEMGMDTIILDDGWQTNDTSRRYWFAGDWEVCEDKFPNFKDHIEKVHTIGMKYMLWLSVPYVGIKSKLWDKFKDKILYFHDYQKAGILDVRYLDVQEYIINKYISLVEEFNLDGLKLDFVDDFYLKSGTEDLSSSNSGFDFQSLQQAVDYMMYKIRERLRKNRPDFMIEFRQRYIGPAMKKYGNILRVADCPNDSNINRINIADLRLIAGKTAVHSDMVMWNKDEPVESAALQIINSLFSTLQYSMRIDELPEDHKCMSKFFIKFMREHEDALLNGNFIPHSPNFSYPIIEGYTNKEKIIAVYAKYIVKMDMMTPEIYIVNGTLDNYVYLEFDDIYEFTIKSFNCIGDLVEEIDMRITKGVFKFEIAKSGILFIKRQNAFTKKQ